LRHPKYGAASEASYYSKVPVVNAGDGKGNHPTQALLDAYTIYKELGSVDGRRILIWGDIEHARTVNSLLEILRLFDVEVHTWNLTDPIGTDLIASSDVIYMTRPQVERHSSFDDPLTKMSKEYNLREDKPVEQSYYGLQKEMLPSIKDDAIILHPLPRTTELPDEVMNDPRVVVFKQAKYGVAIRKAVLQWALK
jgi:aspartate carbamoyltransferase catalytic subunit